MLRDKSLIPLSRQHQHALALCVRIDRASPVSDSDLAAWQTEITQLFQSEIGIHFAAEERLLFPAAARINELAPLVEELLTDHTHLRAAFVKAEGQSLSATDLSDAARHLSAHIRKEERQLFERMQELLSQEELALLGTRLENALKDAAQTCILPTPATTLRHR
jgi:iron-sulfur cluster repair protein YtfE (RIC family)